MRSITDVGGTKRDIVKAAAALSGSRAAFVGGHPIGGAERGGFAFARADLFRGQALDSDAGRTESRADDRAAGRRSFRASARRPTTMDADEHDRLMAFLSHLPQLTVSALMEVVGEATASNGLRLAGRGLVDSTRLASSPADVWREVCASNAGDIGAALDVLIARLQQLRAGLADGETVDAVFAERRALAGRADEGAGILSRIFHITSRAAWAEAQAQGSYTADSLVAEGFIHCSDAHQVVWVANQRFRGTAGSRAAPHRSRAPGLPRCATRTSRAGSSSFPTSTAPIPVAAVVEVVPFRPAADGTFSDACRAQLSLRIVR